MIVFQHPAKIKLDRIGIELADIVKCHVLTEMKGIDFTVIAAHNWAKPVDVIQFVNFL